jgi:hypothetical protein
MAHGVTIGFQGNVPHLGESEITQTVAGLAYDILTITGAVGQTGDYFVCVNSAGTEKLIFSSSAALTVAGPFGCNGQTARASATVSASVTTSTGAIGCSTTSDFVLLVTMINNIRTALINCGICSSTA